MSNHCPIPIGWTVRVYRIPEKQGLAIQAQHESGLEIEESLWIAELRDPQPLTVSRRSPSSVDASHVSRPTTDERRR